MSFITLRDEENMDLYFNRYLCTLWYALDTGGHGNRDTKPVS